MKLDFTKIICTIIIAAAFVLGCFIFASIFGDSIREGLIRLGVGIQEGLRNFPLNR